MHIGIVCYQFGNLNRGGAEVQADNTVAALNKLDGVSTELITYNTTDLKKFDLIHFFKSMSDYEFLSRDLKDKGIPYVVSTVYFPTHYHRDMWKARIMHYTPVLSKLSYMRFIYDLWNNSSCICPNTDEEELYLKRIGVTAPSVIIHNGLDIERLSVANKQAFLSKFQFLQDKSFVLNVARIEPRKNQKKLVEACMKLDLPVVIIGRIGDSDYYRQIQELKYDKLYCLGAIYEPEILYGAFQAARTFALPSTMETPGIAAMEAAYFNIPVAITQFGGTKYYFNNTVDYVDWRSTQSIINGINQSWNRTNVQTKDLMKQYTWDNIALKYKELYQRIIDNK